MNTDTGEIIPMSEVLKKSIPEQKKFMPLSESQFQTVSPMNRKQRRRWARENRK